MGRRLALLIATYQYENAGLRQLTAPAHDAEALAAVLRDPDVAGFDVTMLINEPNHRVGAAIGDFYLDRRSGDLTLLYFTGHGLKDDNGRLYLAMTDTRPDSLLFTAISAEQIDQAMEGCVSRQKVLILDCCYSGAFPAGRLAKADTAVHTLERFQGRGRTVFTASDATQYSFEGDRVHGRATQSVFTRHLVAGLRDGSADLDGDGDITLDELYSYVHDRVLEEMPQQRPKRLDNVQGRTVIARNVNWALPGYLHNAITSPIATDRLAGLDGLAHLYRIGNDAVRDHVRRELERLAEDDSKQVSAAAGARLRAVEDRPAPTEDRPAPMEDRPAPAEDRPAPAEDRPAPAESLPAEPADPPPTPAALETPNAPEIPETRPETPASVAEAPPSPSAPALPVEASPSAAGASARPDPPAARKRRSAPRAALAAVVLACPVTTAAMSLPVRAGDDSNQGGAFLAAIGVVLALTAALGMLGGGTAGPVRAGGPDRALRTAGLLAMAAAVLMLAGVGYRPDTASTEGFWVTISWYVAGMAAVSAAAGGAVLLPRSRELVGPGLVAGAAAASTWGLTFFGSELAYGAAAGRAGDVALWCEFAAHVALLVAAFRTGSAVRRNARARLSVPVPRSARAWALVAVGGLAAVGGAVALAAEVHQATRARWGHDDLPAGFELVNRAFADRTTMVLVLCVPLFALVAAPRRLGLPVLAGWLGGAAAIAVSTFGYARYSEGARSAPALCFALAVLVIAVVAVVAALRPEPTPSGRGAGGALAGLAVAVLLGSSGGAAVAFQAASWPRDDSLRHLLASADGRIYVTRGSAVFTVDTTLHKVVGQAVPGGAEMNAIAVTPDGSRLYTSSGDAVRMIDKSTGRSQFIAVAAAGQMAVSHDGRRLYAGAGDHVSIIDTRAQEVVGFAGNDLASLGALAVSPDGGRLYVSRYGHGVSVIDTKTNRVTGNPIPAGQQSDRMVLNQNGSRLYVGTVNDGVFVIDTAAKAATGRPIRGERPLLSPGGDRLYVIDGDYVAVIDPKTMKALGDPIPAGFLPVDTALSPDGRYLFVSHYRGDSVWMIDTTTRRTVGIPIPAGRS